MMPAVSVIVPNYNHSAYLTERLDSILAQTYQDFEIILMDDCSTDNSRDVIERYRNHERVSHIVFNEANSGSTFSQWAKGIRLAKGKYIWIAESDDWCEPELLDTVINGMDETCVLGYAQSLVVSGDGRVLWNSRAERFEETVSGGEFVSRHMLTKNSIVNASMALFRKECFEKVGNDFTRFRFCGDWLFWILVAVQGNVFISGKVLNYFRKHGSDVSGKAFQEGLYYSEYIQLMEVLTQQGIVNRAQFQKLLEGKFIEFLKDKRVASTVRTDLMTMFQTLLGPHSFVTRAKVGFYQWTKYARSFGSSLLL